MRILILLFLLSILFCCTQQQNKHPLQSFPIQTDPSLAYAHLFRNGKLKNTIPFSNQYVLQNLDSLPFPMLDGTLNTALSNQLDALEKYLSYQSKKIGDQIYSKNDFIEVVQILKRWQLNPHKGIGQELDAYQIWGQDKRGHVKFTGYFTPIVKVKEQKDSIFRYPIYKRPRNWEGPLPSRAEIDGAGFLKEQNLEIAFAESAVDIYYMQLQGSGYIQFPDKTQRLLAYDGTNTHPYRSIETFALNRPDFGNSSLTINGIKRFLRSHPHFQDTLLFHNPSYTFFKMVNRKPSGAAAVPLSAEISIAVDSRYIPLGACLLAAVPVYDPQSKRIIAHDYRILLAQDVGGAIKGTGRLDLYMGIGQEGRRRAEKMSHFGQLWLLLPSYREGFGVYIN